MLHLWKVHRGLNRHYEIVFWVKRTSPWFREALLRKWERGTHRGEWLLPCWPGCSSRWCEKLSRAWREEEICCSSSVPLSTWATASTAGMKKSMIKGKPACRPTPPLSFLIIKANSHRTEKVTTSNYNVKWTFHLFLLLHLLFSAES